MGETPNPGSLEAWSTGCACPVIDNHRGRGMPGPDGKPQFWINSDCPIHGIQAVAKRHNEEAPDAD